jgi:beta-glucanase (GH16 family)
MKRPAAVLVSAFLLLAGCTSPHPSAGPATTGPAAAADSGPASGAAPPMPAGQTAGWTMAFSDEFAGDSLDKGNWSDRSSAEPDQGRGNLDNQQLEWNQGENCQVGKGELTMTARRAPVTSPSGDRYAWTSCLISSKFTFRYGYLEERSILPAPTGFWPAFWTWQARGVDQHTETDVYEFYSDNHTRLYSTQYSGPQGRCDWTPSFDPTAGWHTYGVAIQPTGTTWYADGKQVCKTAATSDAETAIISNLAVYSKIPPESGTTTATKRVDYIRAWRAG